MNDTPKVEMISPEAQELQRVLDEFRVRASVETCTAVGPLRKFAIRLDGLTKVSKVENLAEDIKIRMRAISMPLIYHIPGTDLVGFEMMFGDHPVVEFEALAESLLRSGRKFEPLEVLLGTTEIDKPLIVDLAKLPHLLVAGTTGSGKSMCLHAIINSLYDSLGERDCYMALIDPKQVEFGRYHDMEESRLAYEVATSMEAAEAVLLDVQDRMWKRLKLLAKHGAKDIGEYRASGGKMPHLVVIIDEIAELMRNKKSKFLESMISVAEKGRAAGTHLVIATQHPERTVITGAIKANFPGKIVMKVTTGVHSKVAIDATGAEHLNGRGDALLVDNKQSMLRFQGALVKLSDSIPVPASEVVKKKGGLLSKIVGRFR